MRLRCREKSEGLFLQDTHNTGMHIPMYRGRLEGVPRYSYKGDITQECMYREALSVEGGGESTVVLERENHGTLTGETPPGKICTAELSAGGTLVLLGGGAPHRNVLWYSRGGAAVLLEGKTRGEGGGSRTMNRETVVGIGATRSNDGCGRWD